MVWQVCGVSRLCFSLVLFIWPSRSQDWIQVHDGDVDTPIYGPNSWTNQPSCVLPEKIRSMYLDYTQTVPRRRILPIPHIFICRVTRKWRLTAHMCLISLRSEDCPHNKESDNKELHTHSMFQRNLSVSLTHSITILNRKHLRVRNSPKSENV